MELIDTEERQQGVLPEPEPRYRPAMPEKTEHGQTWLRLALAIVVGIILVILIVLLARWIYHKTHHNVQPAPAVSQNTPAESSSSSNPSSAQPSGSSSSAATNNSPSSSTSSSASTNTQITNTGPGDVAAIFVGASLAAGALHYIISLRRFSKFGA